MRFNSCTNRSFVFRLLLTESNVLLRIDRRHLHHEELMQEQDSMISYLLHHLFIMCFTTPQLELFMQYHAEVTSDHASDL